MFQFKHCFCARGGGGGRSILLFGPDLGLLRNGWPCANGNTMRRDLVIWNKRSRDEKQILMAAFVCGKWASATSDIRDRIEF